MQQQISVANTAKTRPLTFNQIIYTVFHFYIVIFSIISTLLVLFSDYHLIITLLATTFHYFLFFRHGTLAYIQCVKMYRSLRIPDCERVHELPTPLRESSSIFNNQKSPMSPQPGRQSIDSQGAVSLSRSRKNSSSLDNIQAPIASKPQQKSMRDMVRQFQFGGSLKKREPPQQASLRDNLNTESRPEETEFFASKSVQHKASKMQHHFNEEVFYQSAKKIVLKHIGKFIEDYQINLYKIHDLLLHNFHLTILEKDQIPSYYPSQPQNPSAQSVQKSLNWTQPIVCPNPRIITLQEVYYQVNRAKTIGSVSWDWPVIQIQMQKLRQQTNMYYPSLIAEEKQKVQDQLIRLCEQRRIIVLKMGPRYGSFSSEQVSSDIRRLREIVQSLKSNNKMPAQTLWQNPSDSEILLSILARQINILPSVMKLQLQVQWIWRDKLAASNIGVLPPKVLFVLEHKFGVMHLDLLAGQEQIVCEPGDNNFMSALGAWLWEKCHGRFTQEYTEAFSI